MLKHYQDTFPVIYVETAKNRNNENVKTLPSL